MSKTFPGQYRLLIRLKIHEDKFEKKFITLLTACIVEKCATGDETGDGRG